MEIKNLIYLMVGSVIAVLMIGSLLIPFVADYTDSTKEYHNNNFGAYAKVSDQDEIVINITTTIGTAGTTNATVNGTVLDVPQGPRALVIADSFVIFQNYSNGIQVAGPIEENGALYHKDHSSVNLSINNNVATFTLLTSNGENVTLNTTFSWCYYKFVEGDYRLIDYIATGQSRTVYYNSLDQIHGSNVIGRTGQFFAFTGNDVTVFNSDGSSYTTTATVEITNVMNNVSSFVVDSDRANSKAFHFTVDDNGSPYDVYPYYFVVPYEVYGITEQNTVINSIFSIIPIIFVAGVVVTVVYWAIGRK